MTAHDLFANVHSRPGPQPRGNRRIMRSFVIDEVSAVDKPAQEGATAILMKGARFAKSYGGVSVIKDKMQGMEDQLDPDEFAKEPEAAVDTGQDPDELTPDEQEKAATLAQQLMARDPRLGKARAQLMAQCRVAKATALATTVNEEEGGIGPDDDDQDASEHQGDWPMGSGDPGPGDGPPATTRVDDYVSADEIEDVDAEIAAKADDLMRRDRRISPRRAHAMAAARVATGPTVRKAINMADPMGLRGSGTERAMRRRDIEMAMKAVRERIDPYATTAQQMQIVKRAFPHLFP